MSRRFTITTASLALLAGTALPASVAMAQNHDRKQHQNQRITQTDRQSPTLGFYKTSSLLGTDITNANGKVVGDLHDLILDRGTGQVEYIVLSSGGFLGLGDKEVAVPYEATGFDHNEGRFTLDVTPELLEGARVRAP